MLKKLKKYSNLFRNNKSKENELAKGIDQSGLLSLKTESLDNLPSAFESDENCSDHLWMGATKRIEQDSN